MRLSWTETRVAPASRAARTAASTAGTTVSSSPSPELPNGPKSTVSPPAVAASTAANTCGPGAPGTNDSTVNSARSLTRVTLAARAFVAAAGAPDPRDTRPMSSFIFNVTFDCADPTALADFWSSVTGYELTEARDDFARLTAPDRRGVRHLLFFRVAEAKTAKNRMHVDLASRDPDAEITRLVTLGASLVDGAPAQWRTGNGTRWVVMQDPEGNEFCLG